MHKVSQQATCGAAGRTLQIFEVLCFLLVVHVDSVVKHNQGAAAEQVSNVAGKNIIDARTLKATERLVIDGRVNVIEAFNVVGSADEQADGAVARLELAAGWLSWRRGCKAALMRGPDKKFRGEGQFVDHFVAT